MITTDRYQQGLRALQRLIVQAKAQAHDGGQDDLAVLLNDIELLPEFLADEVDRTAEFVEMLESIARAYPQCGYIVEEFRQTPAAAT
jgi:hypothetical protein